MKSREDKQIYISDEQRSNLINELALLVNKFKNDDNVDCICFSNYSKYGNLSNVLEFTIIYKNDYNEKDIGLSDLREEYLKKIDALGVHVIFCIDKACDYTTMPMNALDYLRANYLYNSNILFDRSGNYTEIKSKAGDYTFDEESQIFEYQDLATLYPPIDEDLSLKLELGNMYRFGM